MRDHIRVAGLQLPIECVGIPDRFGTSAEKIMLSSWSTTV